MPTDRELLKWAAQAAGYQVVWHHAWNCFVHLKPFNTDEPPTLAGQRLVWIPLNDDGDALRLAVKLRLRVDIGVFSAAVSVRPKDEAFVLEQDAADPRAAVRRAIVRAGAEIYKAMAIASQTPGGHQHAAPDTPNDEYCPVPCRRCDAISEAMRPLVTPPAAPKVKDHVLAAVVNNLRDVAIQFHAAGQLRARLREALGPLLSGIEAPTSDPSDVAKRCTCPSGDGTLRWPCPVHPAFFPNHQTRGLG